MSGSGEQEDSEYVEESESEEVGLPGFLSHPLARDPVQAWQG